jgi:hypothetical protein
MANVQLVRTRQTYATTTINEVQSIQLVQTMLHGAMSTLTYLRELFPEKAFEYRYYEMRETPLPYKDFAAARMPSYKSEAGPHSTKLPVLLRKRSKRADLFLDWLVSAFACHPRPSLTRRRRKESSRNSTLVSFVQCSYSSIPTRKAGIQCSRHIHSPSTTPSAKMVDVHRAVWRRVRLGKQPRQRRRQT